MPGCHQLSLRGYDEVWGLGFHAGAQEVSAAHGHIRPSA